MKKIGFLLLGLTAILACSKTEQLPSQSLLANTFGVRVHDFTSDVSTKVTTTSYNSTTFNWQNTDKIGVFPLTVDDRQETTQLGCTLQSSEANQATFQGSGWGLICNGKYEYASYYPYSEKNSKTAIKVSFPANLNATNGATMHIAPYVSMYAPAITPSNVESASFDFYQVGALAHFVITAPTGVQYTKLVISTSDESNVFTTEGTYNLTAVTSKVKPVIVPTMQVNAIGMSLNATLAEGKQLSLYFIMAPAQLAGKTLNFKLFDGNNKKYTGTKTCTTNQESGKIYKYSVTLTEETVTFDPKTIEGVDLGHPLYLFAPFNLGATSIEETGDFFAWGETATKETFTEENYLLKDVIYSDALITNERSPLYTMFKPEYDAAHQLWGNGWMVPNYLEINGFLQDQCAKEWVTINGTQGWKCYKVIDNGNDKVIDYTKWIFLPATGIKYGNDVLNTHRGFYWTSLSNGTNYFAETCSEGSPNNMGTTAARHNGLAIRPVKYKNQQNQ